MQDLCAYLDVAELESVAEFPEELSVLRALLARVDEYSANRLKLTEIAFEKFNVPALFLSKNAVLAGTAEP